MPSRPSRATLLSTYQLTLTPAKSAHVGFSSSSHSNRQHRLCQHPDSELPYRGLTHFWLSENPILDTLDVSMASPTRLERILALKDPGVLLYLAIKCELSRFCEGSH